MAFRWILALFLVPAMSLGAKQVVCRDALATSLQSYQTEFEIVYNGSKSTAWTTVLTSIHRWLRSKHLLSLPSFPSSPTTLFVANQWEEDGIRIQSRVFGSDPHSPHPRYWALRYETTHPSYDMDGRQWTTDLGVTAELNKLRVSVANRSWVHTESFQERTVDQSVLPVGIVGLLCGNNHNHWRCQSGDTPFTTAPMGPETYSKSNLLQWVQDPNRTVPLIFLARRSATREKLFSPMDLSQRLYGSALVFYGNESTLQGLLREVSVSETEGSDVAIFWPVVAGTSPTLVSTRNRTKQELYTLLQKFRSEVLRFYAPTTDSEWGVRSNDGIGLMVQQEKSRLSRVTRQLHAQRLRRTETHTLSEASAQLDELQSLVEVYEEVVGEQDEELSRLRTELSAMRAEKEKARQSLAEIRHYQGLYEALVREKNQNGKRAAWETLKSLPTKYDEVVAFAREQFGTRLIITDNAKSTFEKFAIDKKFTVAKALNLLAHMATHLHDAYFDEERDTSESRSRWFQQKSGFELVEKEREQTENTPRFRQQREFVYHGETVQAFSHLRAYKSLRMRIYFYVDTKRKKIVIHHMGTHLDTAGQGRQGR